MVQNWGIIKTRIDLRGTTWKWILTIFKFRNVCYKQSKKSRWKNGVICLVSMFPSWVMVLKLSKKIHFLQFCAGLRKRAKSVKVICIYGSERSHCTLWKNIWFIGVWGTTDEMLVIKMSKKMLTQQKSNNILRLLNISETVSHQPEPNIHFMFQLMDYSREKNVTTKKKIHFEKCLKIKKHFPIKTSFQLYS